MAVTSFYWHERLQHHTQMRDTDGVMANDSQSTTRNGGRATLRDVMEAVMGLNSRIDGTNERIDDSVVAQHHLNKRMGQLHDAMSDLRETTNDRLHEIEADVIMLKRPWVFLAYGWTKSIALAGMAAGVSSMVMKFELWRFIPGL